MRAHTGGTVQERSQLAQKLEAAEAARADIQARFDGQIDELTIAATTMEAQLKETQAELDDTRVLLKCAEQREADMSASIDLSEV